MNESTVTFWQTMTFVQILLKAKIMGLKARMKMTLMQLQAMLAGRSVSDGFWKVHRWKAGSLKGGK